MKEQKESFNPIWGVFIPFFIFVYLSMASCSDELERPSSSAYISFSPTIDHSWHPVTRASEDTLRGIVVPLQTDGGKALYLHTLYSDGLIPSSLAGDKNTLATRAVPVKEGNMYETFGVSAYTYVGSWDGNQTPDLMYDVSVKSSGNYWTTTPSSYVWPGSSSKIRFFAYAPKGNTAYRLSDQTATGAPTLTCTVPRDVSMQKDLLVAGSGEVGGNVRTAVSLSFRHALTAVRFVCGDDMRAGTVKSVALKGVYSSAIYDMETEEWRDMGSKDSFLQVLDKETNGTVNDTITTEPQTFMMIPQTLPDGAAVEIVFNDGAQDHTLKADIKISVWPRGKTVTYKISTSSINWTYFLTVTGPDKFTYKGGNSQYSVISYKENTQQKKEEAAWTTQYSTDDGASWSDTKPAWLTAFTSSGSGSLSGQSYGVTVSAQNGTFTDDHTAALWGASPKGSESRPYNLSNKRGEPEVENTANCYVVDAPGIYSFPLVYGNAIKNGKDNPSSYNPFKKGKDRVLAFFINHRCAPIMHPYIADNLDCKPTRGTACMAGCPIFGHRYQI